MKSLKEDFANISSLLEQLTDNTNRAKKLINLVKHNDEYSEDELIDIIGDSLHVIFK